jgi:hypothetical protein
MNKRITKRHQSKEQDFKLNSKNHKSIADTLRNPHNCKYCAHCSNKFPTFCILYCCPCCEISNCQSYYSNIKYFKLYESFFKN